LNWIQEGNSSLNHSTAAIFFRSRARLRRLAMHHYLWNDTCQLFVDYLLPDQNHPTQIGHRSCLDPAKDPVFISSLYPIFTRAFPTATDFASISHSWPMPLPLTIHQIIQGAQRLNASFLSAFEGGIPTSRHRSVQQWDFPNAWPPLQWMSVEATRIIWQLLSDQPDEQARWTYTTASLIGRWLRTNLCGWKRLRNSGQAMPNNHSALTKRSYDQYILKDAYRTHRFRRSTPSNETILGGMFEKYDVERIGYPGGGGEYVVQGTRCCVEMG
jgi:alpha,alpha-trehalase